MERDVIHLTSSTLVQRFGVNVRTLHRWLAKPSLGFPRPVVINGRRYWKADEVARWEESGGMAPT